MLLFLSMLRLEPFPDLACNTKVVGVKNSSNIPHLEVLPVHPSDGCFLHLLLVEYCEAIGSDVKV
jgi:hypothetical protein